MKQLNISDEMINKEIDFQKEFSLNQSEIQEAIILFIKVKYNKEVLIEDVKFDVIRLVEPVDMFHYSETEFVQAKVNCK